jgi:hypothetical protein
VGATLSAARLIAPGELTFSRASARTNSDTGAEIATGVAFIPTIEEIVPTGISEVAGSDGYFYVGRLSDGRYVLNGTGGIYTSTNGEPPYTLLVANTTVSRITPADTFLRFTSSEPASIYRRPAPYTVETLVHQVNRGFIVVNGPSGTNTHASASMNYGANGSTIILMEYSNTAGIKDSADPPRYLHRSPDDGVTWAVIDPTGATPNTHGHALFYDSVTGNWYASYGDTNPTRGIYKSVNNGVNWTQIIGPTAPALYDQTVQPVSAMRFGNYIVWGSDEAPSALWIHDPTDDSIDRVPAGYVDFTAGITWAGVLYNLAKVGNFVIVLPSQGQEDYATLWATDNLRRFWKVLDTNDAERSFYQPIVRDDGSFLVRRTVTASANFVKVSGLELRQHQAIATDESVNTLAASTAPLDGTGWSFSSGEYIGATGPGGLRAYKLGNANSLWPPEAITAGDVVQMTAWLRNPLGIASTAQAMFEVTAQDAGSSNTLFKQKVIFASAIPKTEWVRASMRYTMPANTVKVYMRLFLSAATYNASTTYFEVAGLTAGTLPFNDVETHDRAAESATVDKVVGVAWGVYDRVFPRWDTYELTADKTLLTLTDVDTSAYLSVVYNATGKAFEITDGTDTETGAVVRCLGSGTHALIRDTGVVRTHYDQRDFMAYGVRRAGGTTQLIVWDKANRVIAAVAAPGSFAPSNLRITFPASGVLHVPSFASGELTDAQTFSALQGIEDTDGAIGLVRRSTFQVGDQLTLQSTFVSLDGVNADPTTITLKVCDPGGTITTYTYAGGDVTKFATGIYRYRLSITLPGRWLYKWLGAGAVQAASPDGVVDVQTSVF